MANAEFISLEGRIFFLKREGKTLRKTGCVFHFVLESTYCTIQEKRQ